MSAYNGEHVSSDSSEKSPFADAKVDNLNLLRLGVVQNILWFDVSVARVPMMNVLDGLEKLSKNIFESWFGQFVSLVEARKVEEFGY